MPSFSTGRTCVNPRRASSEAASGERVPVWHTTAVGFSGVERGEVGLGQQAVGHGDRARGHLALLRGLAHVDDLQVAAVCERAHLAQADRLEARVRVGRVDAEADLGELREADRPELAHGFLRLLVRLGHHDDLALGIEREPAAVAEAGHRDRSR